MGKWKARSAGFIVPRLSSSSEFNLMIEFRLARRWYLYIHFESSSEVVSHDTKYDTETLCRVYIHCVTQIDDKERLLTEVCESRKISVEEMRRLEAPKRIYKADVEVLKCLCEFHKLAGNMKSPQRDVTNLSKINVGSIVDSILAGQLCRSRSHFAPIENMFLPPDPAFAYIPARENKLPFTDVTPICMTSNGNYIFVAVWNSIYGVPLVNGDIQLDAFRFHTGDLQLSHSSSCFTTRNTVVVNSAENERVEVTTESLLRQNKIPPVRTKASQSLWSSDGITIVELLIDDQQPGITVYDMNMQAIGTQKLDLHHPCNWIEAERKIDWKRMKNVMLETCGPYLNVMIRGRETTLCRSFSVITGEHVADTVLPFTDIVSVTYDSVNRCHWIIQKIDDSLRLRKVLMKGPVNPFMFDIALENMNSSDRDLLLINLLHMIGVDSLPECYRVADVCELHRKIVDAHDLDEISRTTLLLLFFVNAKHVIHMGCNNELMMRLASCLSQFADYTENRTFVFIVLASMLDEIETVQDGKLYVKFYNKLLLSHKHWIARQLEKSMIRIATSAVPIESSQNDPLHVQEFSSVQMFASICNSLFRYSSSLLKAYLNNDGALTDIEYILSMLDNLLHVLPSFCGIIPITALVLEMMPSLIDNVRAVASNLMNEQISNSKDRQSIQCIIQDLTAYMPYVTVIFTVNAIHGDEYSRIELDFQRIIESTYNESVNIEKSLENARKELNCIYQSWRKAANARLRQEHKEIEARIFCIFLRRIAHSLLFATLSDGSERLSKVGETAMQRVQKIRNDILLRRQHQQDTTQTMAKIEFLCKCSFDLCDDENAVSPVLQEIEKFIYSDCDLAMIKQLAEVQNDRLKCVSFGFGSLIRGMKALESRSSDTSSYMCLACSEIDEFRALKRVCNSKSKSCATLQKDIESFIEYMVNNIGQSPGDFELKSKIGYHRILFKLLRDCASPILCRKAIQTLKSRDESVAQDMCYLLASKLQTIDIGVPNDTHSQIMYASSISGMPNIENILSLRVSSPVDVSERIVTHMKVMGIKCSELQRELENIGAMVLQEWDLSIEVEMIRIIRRAAIAREEVKATIRSLLREIMRDSWPLSVERRRLLVGILMTCYGLHGIESGLMRVGDKRYFPIGNDKMCEVPVVGDPIIVPYDSSFEPEKIGVLDILSDEAASHFFNIAMYNQNDIMSLIIALSLQQSSAKCTLTQSHRSRTIACETVSWKDFDVVCSERSALSWTNEDFCLVMSSTGSEANQSYAYISKEIFYDGYNIEVHISGRKSTLFYVGVSDPDEPLTTNPVVMEIPRRLMWFANSQEKVVYDVRIGNGAIQYDSKSMNLPRIRNGYRIVIIARDQVDNLKVMSRTESETEKHHIPFDYNSALDTYALYNPNVLQWSQEAIQMLNSSRMGSMTCKLLTEYLSRNIASCIKNHALCLDLFCSVAVEYEPMNLQTLLHDGNYPFATDLTLEKSTVIAPGAVINAIWNGITDFDLKLMDYIESFIAEKPYNVPRDFGKVMFLGRKHCNTTIDNSDALLILPLSATGRYSISINECNYQLPTIIPRCQTGSSATITMIKSRVAVLRIKDDNRGWIRGTDFELTILLKHLYLRTKKHKCRAFVKACVHRLLAASSSITTHYCNSFMEIFVRTPYLCSDPYYFDRLPSWKHDTDVCMTLRQYTRCLLFENPLETIKSIQDMLESGADDFTTEELKSFCTLDIKRIHNDNEYIKSIIPVVIDVFVALDRKTNESYFPWASAFYIWGSVLLYRNTIQTSDIVAAFKDDMNSLRMHWISWKQIVIDRLDSKSNEFREKAIVGAPPTVSLMLCYIVHWLNTALRNGMISESALPVIIRYLPFDCYIAFVIHSPEGSTRMSIKLDRKTSEVPLIQQLFDSLKHPILKHHQLQAQEPWKISFNGEEGFDAGGLRHEAFSEIAKSARKQRDLFIDTNQHEIVPNPKCTNKEMYHLIGMLLMISLRMKTPMPLPLPDFVFAFVCGQEVTPEMLEKTDSDLRDQFGALRRCGRTGSTMVRWLAEDWEGNVVHLRDGAPDLAAQDIPVYINAVVQMRLDSLRMSLQWIKEGFMHNGGLTDAKLRLLPADWVKQHVVCSPTVTTQDLKRVCAGFDVSIRIYNMFWRVVDKLDNEERIKLLQFATGRSGIPCCIKDMQPPLHLYPANSSLFGAMTCFGYLLVPIGLNEDQMLVSLRTSIATTSFDRG